MDQIVHPITLSPSVPEWLDRLFFRLSLIVLGCLIIWMIVQVKSHTALSLSITSPIYLYTMAITSFQLTRLASAMLYTRTKRSLKKTYEGEVNYEPRITFVIPFLNEQDAIANTISKCFESDYPAHKIEVIAVNDGSTDNSVQVIKKLQQKYDRLVLAGWKENRGKRHGMAEGFKLATGEIVVQLDSDSYIDPSTIKSLVQPFANPEIGAICAHADPQNADANWLTRMQAAYYFMSFRILKAAESTFTTVFCCSGCSSAYRKSIILPIIDKWLGEKFLGRPVTWGDDRALTNWVLRQGYLTIYSDDTQAYTICPDNFKKFLKQQIRWKKGWFVNSLFASKFIIKKDPFVAFTYFFPLVFITLITPFMAVRALIYNPIFRGIAPWYYLAGIFLMTILMTTYYRWVARENKYWPFMLIWSTINTILLSFVLFYSLATIQDRRWGTR